MDASISLTTVRSKHICLSLFLISTFVYLLSSHLLPITDPVESNYALTAKEMITSSDWLSPRIYGQIWFDKPILFYWLTALSFKLFGFSDFAARLMPALFAGSGVTLVYWFLNKTVSHSVALLSALVLGTSLEYVLLSKFVITDMVLFVFNSAALAFFYLGYSRAEGTKRWYLAMYISMALAVLTKGPVGLILPVFVIIIFLSLKQEWTETKNMSVPVGLLLFSLITLPWYGGMYYMHGSKFVDTFLGIHNYLRATVSEHPKDNVFYYYAVVFLLSMLPWAPLTLKAMVAAYKTSLLKSPLRLFSLIWAGVYLVFYSLMATKYLTYTFPTLFPLAVLTGLYLDELLRANKKSTILYWVGVPLVLSSVTFIAATYHYYQTPWLIAVGSALMLNMAVTLWKASAYSGKYVLGLLCVHQIAVYMLLSFILFPTMADTRSAKELAQNLAEYRQYQIGFYDFYSTSAVYYSGQTAVRVTSSEMAALPSSKLSWSSKYTMPTESLASFTANPAEGRVIIVPAQRKQYFLESITGNWSLLKETGKFSYYYLGQ
jgi:4-amino-4-deoxy-L-arabinose transferase-like glycosyltransferase